MIDLQKLEDYLKNCLKDDKSGHDYPHVMRVMDNVKEIIKNYPEVENEVLLTACLLHDIAFKDGFVKNHHLIGAKQTGEILKQFNFPEEKIRKVQISIEDHCGMMVDPVRKDSELCIESKILRDADNIDAFGAIGIIRQIAFCTANGIPYFKSKGDKLNESMYGGMKEIITWKNKMLTPEGKRIAESRIPIMKKWCKQIEKEYA